MGAPDEGSWLEPEEVEPRLLLFGPPGAMAIEPRLATALAMAKPAAFVSATEARSGAAALAGERLACARAATAFLRWDEVEMAAQGLADGVHLARPQGMAEARRKLGPERLIGCGVGLSRHDAMVAGEEGADYLLFGSLDGETDLGVLQDLLDWWSALFVLPAAAAVRAAEPESALDGLLAAGADFLAVGGTDWEMPEFERRLEGLARLCATARRPA